MLAGEAWIDFGQLVLAKGTRVALHDQRPPRERDLTLRDYVLSARADLIALERELADLEHAMARGETGQRTLDGYAQAQHTLELAGGYTWRERALAKANALGFDDSSLDRPLASFSG